MKVKTPSTRKTKKGLFENPVCNYCSSEYFDITLSGVTSWEYKGTFQIVKCRSCNLIYLSPRPTQKEIGKYYQSESYWGEDITLEDDSTRVEEREYTFGSLYSCILKQKKKGKILDIGAGTGVFLSKFKELGWSVDGVEFSKDAVDFAKKSFGIRLKKGDFLDFTFPKETYDVVTLNMAIEHLYDPSKTLQEIYNVLKRKGIVVITTQNIQSVGYELFKANWQALNLPRHLYQFSEKSLANLMTKAGFEISGINYWYWAHNYYTVFESFRFTLSPRFKKKNGGGLSSSANQKQNFSIKNEVGKIVFKTLSLSIVLIGSLLQRSESITVYGVKR